MGQYLTRRSLHSLASLAGLIVLVFFLARLTGDPTNLYLPLDASLQARAEFAKKHGFNDPLLEQFGRFLQGLARLDLGDSVRKARPAIEVVLEAFPTTLRLAAITMSAAVGLAVLVGSLAAYRPGGAFDRIEFLPRVLNDVSHVDTSTTILGKQSACPFVLAPTGYTRMMHTEGESAVARVARRAGIPYALSTMGTTTPEDLAAASDGGRLWFQLYVWKDRARSKELVARARASGFDTLVLTVDVPVGSNRERNRRNGFGRPLNLSLAAKLDALCKPHWFKDYMRYGRPTLPNWAPYLEPGADAEKVGAFVTQQVRATLTASMKPTSAMITPGTSTSPSRCHGRANEIGGNSTPWISCTVLPP